MGRSKYTVRPDGLRQATKTYKNFGNVEYTGRKYFYGHTDAEVDQKIRAFEDWCNKDVIPPGKLFKRFSEKYWAAKEPELSPNSVNNYRIALERAEDEFGNMAISEIKPKDCLRFLNKFKDLSQKTLGNTRTVLKSIFDVALIDEAIESNPCISLPRIKGSTANKRPRKPAPEEEVKIVEEFKTESLASRFYYFLLYTGLRRSEALALKGSDFDLEAKTVKVGKQIYFQYSIPHEKKPKTEAGERVVGIPDNVIEILPDMSDPDRYIWFPDGVPHEKDVEKWIKSFRIEHNLTATPHQYRHSYASMLHSAEIDVKDAQFLLGHSTIAMTQDIYTHLERQHKIAVQSKLNSYIKDVRNHDNEEIDV